MEGPLLALPSPGRRQWDRLHRHILVVAALTTVDFSTLIVSCFFFVHSYPSRGRSVILSSGPLFSETPRCPGGMATKPCGATRLNGDPGYVGTFAHRSPKMSSPRGAPALEGAVREPAEPCSGQAQGRVIQGPSRCPVKGGQRCPAGQEEVEARTGQPCLPRSWARPLAVNLQRRPLHLGEASVPQGIVPSGSSLPY